MDGPTVLYYGHWIGIVFVALWMIGTTPGDGLWGNTLVYMSWMISLGLAWTLAIPLCALVNGWVSDAESEWMPYFVYLGVTWSLVILFFAPIRLLTDKLSSMKVAFPKPMDQIGSRLVSLLTAFCLCIGFLRAFPNSNAFLKAWFVAMGLP